MIILDILLILPKYYNKTRLKLLFNLKKDDRCVQYYSITNNKRYNGMNLLMYKINNNIEIINKYFKNKIK